MMRQLLVFVCVLVVLRTAALPVCVEASEKQISGQFRYSHEPMEGEPDFTEIMYQEGDFTGRATHIGSFTGTGETYVEFIDVPDPDRFEGIEAITEFRGNFTWSRPEGTLEGNFVGWNYLIFDDGTPVFGVVAILTVKDGTGRFYGAKGELLAMGIDDPYDLLGISGVDAEFSGTLILPED